MDNMKKVIQIPKKEKKKTKCYVLITCEEPTDQGEMSVEMTYEGDLILASYLVENARTVLTRKIEESR